MNDHVFYNTKVQYFRIPSSVSNLNSQPFDQGHAMIWISVDPENKYFCDVDCVLYSRDMTVLWFYPGDHGERFVNVPNTVHTIQLAAFSTSNIIQYINIPSSVKTIVGYQFIFMHTIEYIEIMNKNELINFDYAFILYDSHHNTSCIHFIPIPIITKNCPNFYYFSFFHSLTSYSVFIMM